ITKHLPSVTYQKPYTQGRLRSLSLTTARPYERPAMRPPPATCPAPHGEPACPPEAQQQLRLPPHPLPRSSDVLEQVYHSRAHHPLGNSKTHQVPQQLYLWYSENMIVSDVNSAIASGVQAFIGSTTPRDIAANYRLLVAMLWSDGKPSSLALSAVPILIESL